MIVCSCKLRTKRFLREQVELIIDQCGVAPNLVVDKGDLKEQKQLVEAILPSECVYMPFVASISRGGG